MEQVKSFKIIGIAIETTNENWKSAEDIGALWAKFINENIASKIPNKESEEIYAIYTDYESNFKGKYTTIIGQKVNSLKTIPAACVGREFQGAKYAKFLAKGVMPNAIVDIWKDIWDRDKDLRREYSADFEVYGEKSQNGKNSEVEIYIAVK